MCGVVAFAGRALPSMVMRAAALARLSHRGPDARGNWEHRDCWLGHNRLSILDPSPDANQPMDLGESGPWIAYNGEIYNHRALRLSDRRYRTGSDTESLLCLWSREGTSCLDRLDGIFGFVLVDEEGAIFAARDRLGVKPMYLAARDGGVWLASEIKAIPGTVGGAIPDTRAMTEYIRYEGMTGTKTLFRGVESLPPGSYASVGEDTRATSVRSFHGPFSNISPEAYSNAARWEWKDATDQLETVLRRGIESQMLSDVPIGTLCSGGVDSSLVTAIVHRKEPSVQIFAVDFREREASEREYIEAVAAHLGVKVHYSVLDREGFLADLVDCIYHNDHPLSHANSVGIYRVSSLAREHGVKVLLTGEGADELFGGYESYTRLLRRLRWQQRVAWLPDGFRRRLRELMARPGEARDSILLRSSEGDLARVAHGHLGRAKARVDALAAWHFVSDPVEREMLGALSSDLLEYLDPILNRQDRMSMMAGVESRVPFLSNDTVAFAANLPIRLRIRDGEGKALLKACADRYLPRSIVRRPKVGFRIPLASWVRLPSGELFKNGFLEQELGGGSLLEHGGAPASLRFALLNLELWGRIFVRGEDRGELTERLLKASEGLTPDAVTRATRTREKRAS